MQSPRCEKCDKQFIHRWHLARHQQRKTPCVPQAVPGKETYQCEACKKHLATASSLSRHRLHTCPNRTPDPQLQQLRAEFEAKLDELKGQIRAPATREAGPVSNITNVTNTTNVTNVSNTTNVTAVIIPWSDANNLRVTAEAIEKALLGTPSLNRFVHSGYTNVSDTSQCVPHVIETLMACVRYLQNDPAAQNMRLNPQRADQALVYDQAGWQARALSDTTRETFDRVTAGVGEMLGDQDEWKKLSRPHELGQPLLQIAAMCIPSAYNKQPEHFVEKGKAPFVAHLQNMQAQYAARQAAR
jgi:hypothetical protein